MNIKIKNNSIKIILTIFVVYVFSWTISSIATDDISSAHNNFSVVGIVSGIDGEVININNAKGSDKTGADSYQLNIKNIEKIETNKYQTLSLSDIKVGDKIIAQGLTNGTTFFIKRLISFADVKVVENAISTSTEDVSFSDISSSTTDIPVSTIDENTASISNPSTSTDAVVDVSTTTDNVDNATTTVINVSTTTDISTSTATSTDNIVDKVIDVIQEVVDVVTDKVSDILNNSSAGESTVSTESATDINTITQTSE